MSGLAGPAIDLVPVSREISVPSTTLTASTPEAINTVRRLETEMRKHEQLEFVTEHLLHAGMYTRTVHFPADSLIAAVLFKVATVLIIQGSAEVWSNGELIRVDGYTVVPCAAGRKIALVTRSDLSASMMFPTDAKTVEEAQMQFTDEYEMLVPLSVPGAHTVLITGE
jgi:hypothetical protein